MGSGYDSATVAQDNEAKGLERNLDLIYRYGTVKDKDVLRRNCPLSKIFYQRLKKAGKSMS